MYSKIKEIFYIDFSGKMKSDKVMILFMLLTAAL
jgi:hypothetical protein